MVLALLGLVPWSALALERSVQDPALLARPTLARAEPLDLRWSAPADPDLWARLEIPARAADDQSVRGVMSIGRRVPVLDCAEAGFTWCEGLRMTATPLARGIPDAPAASGGTMPATGLGLAQDLEYKMFDGFRLRAGADLGDRLGISAPLTPDSSGLAVKARAGFGADLARLGTGLPVQLDITLAVVRDAGEAPVHPHANDCEGIIDIRLRKNAPLRLTLPCSQSGGPTFGFGIRGVF